MVQSRFTVKPVESRIAAEIRPDRNRRRVLTLTGDSHPAVRDSLPSLVHNEAGFVCEEQSRAARA
ncbi:hypothetical protein HOE425_340093 [Hoeflea sp. EC-HK425]|nr:hypothetical protein HOE425_340093 [Hoeflea sp. EC-HK425]